ncbi:DUF5615 family PIN-like protein [Candidatus Venteria ishoeyi]|uniref:DUF5615 domain-containing protein n=1 Tax=Candidatus Venteria ishoeyi TaxID=1899563 RepID=A0A1H6FHJ7_9GAMM|nr:DUF5615 family PIN-like protein [Candidatus Venteria ishoeyi]MDM8546753.1 DUF5615 family PIN-like protein [Candidatus Venteria ishoeyi]SEH09123.1 Uncharacterised protein [Candidatus Venteria ishoeyi]SEH09252.1 Uncharacterised protein [Candidatus Venteria ishoeyi]
MKLLLDQGLPRTAAKLLNEEGISATHVGDIGYATAEDEKILELGEHERYVIVTLDADFHALLALKGLTWPSVIRIRIEGLKAKAVVALLKTVLNHCAQDLLQGVVVTVQDERIRVRRLPLGMG